MRGKEIDGCRYWTYRPSADPKKRMRINGQIARQDHEFICNDVLSKLVDIDKAKRIRINALTEPYQNSAEFSFKRRSTTACDVLRLRVHGARNFKYYVITLAFYRWLQSLPSKYKYLEVEIG